MSKLDLNSLRRELEAERERLLRARPEEEPEDNGDDNPDEFDLADSLAEKEVRQSLEQLSEGVLERIDKALGRLEAGTYGKCQKCGAEIPDERLQALPYAELCVDCQSRMEERKQGLPV